ncbi:hypothetical protein NUU61_009775 [Penicillium alfredii]|uniref:Sphingomyelin phosphodiesterase n=1 Tax=Penicillium alfredii TaxID=1506179 RepID=A0A9W9JU02_9EURO|nr:uncharacterized protein NUU61_009775 [Penicillium alfredii]KAJ5081511.1 hypothetical protein NUU61_009775 [Penicillium alfredii]
MRLAVLLAIFGLLASGVQSKSADEWITTIWDHFKEAVDCSSCQILLSGLKLVADLGEPALVDVLTGVCNLSGAEDHDVCSGVIEKEAPAVHYMLKNLKLGSRTAETLCASIAGLCDYPAVQPFNLTFPSPKPATTRPPPSGKSPIKVVHFSDTHVDLSYETGANSQCTKPICCRAYTEKDAPGNTSSPCGPWGHPKCDPPLRLHESMLAAIADLHPAFSIYTGDVVSHDVWLVTESEVLQDFNATYGAMEKNLGVVYAAVGNHDAAPLNLFPSNKLPSTFNPQWAYDAIAADWKTLTGLPSVYTARQHGSYSAMHPNSKLRIISYNSVFYYKYNFHMYTEPMDPDPDNQLAWLIDELQAAESADQRVWLISHIPSGNSDTFRDHSHALDQVVRRYEATIAALFFGHTHTDLFQVAYTDYAHRRWDTSAAVGYIVPSMTPTSGPASFRVYEIDPVTFGVLDYTQYIANISSFSSSGHDDAAAAAAAVPQWMPYYAAKADYGSKLSPPIHDPAVELTPAFWHNVTVAMERDPDVFQQFWSRRTRGYNVTTCAGDCVPREICALRGADAQYNCAAPTGGFSFSKRDQQKNGEAGLVPGVSSECDHAGMAPLLGKMVYRARLGVMHE